MLGNAIYLWLAPFAIMWAIRVQINTANSDERSENLIGMFLTYFLVMAALVGGLVAAN